MCHIPGIDICTYNNTVRGQYELIPINYVKMQKIVDESVLYINAAIDSMNLSSNVLGPWIHDTIHANIHGKRVHKYLKFYDGLHPNDHTLQTWSRKIISSLKSDY